MTTTNPTPDQGEGSMSKKLDKLEREVTAFNNQISVGDWVDYYDVIESGESTRYRNPHTRADSQRSHGGRLAGGQERLRVLLALLPSTGGARMSADLPKLPQAAYSLDLHDGFPTVAYSAQQMYDFANAARQEATRQAMERLEPLRHAGAMLSNCAFNLAQRNPGQFTARDIEALDSSRKAWDEALRALTNESDKK